MARRDAKVWRSTCGVTPSSFAAAHAFMNTVRSARTGLPSRRYFTSAPSPAFVNVTGDPLLAIHGIWGDSRGDLYVVRPGARRPIGRGARPQSVSKLSSPAWFADDNGGVGIVTGATSGVIALDADGPEGKRALFALGTRRARRYQ